MKRWKIKSFKHFQQLYVGNQEFRDNVNTNPEETILNAKIPDNPLSWDKWIYRITVIGLVLIVITIIISVVIMYGEDETSDFQVPDLFVAIGSGAIGAIAGLLTPTPTEKKEA